MIFDAVTTWHVVAYEYTVTYSGSLFNGKDYFTTVFRRRVYRLPPAKFNIALHYLSPNACIIARARRNSSSALRTRRCRRPHR
jgi:hypothetical protein